MTLTVSIPWKVVCNYKAFLCLSLPCIEFSDHLGIVFFLNSMDSNSDSVQVPVTIPVVSTIASPLDSPANSSRKPIGLWPGMYHSPVTSALWETRSKIFERLLGPNKDAPPQSELLLRTPSQSRTSILYSFSSDYTLREQYRDPWNEVRIGKLLEDLDALAGAISVRVPCLL